MSTQTTDRELLELAAKAAGINLWWDGDSPKEVVQHWSGNPEDGGETRDYPWNPLEDDGDALRLAVSLHLSLTLNSYGAGVGGVDVNLRQVFEREKAGAGGLPEATRRAIVRAAAEIGRQMP